MVRQSVINRINRYAKKRGLEINEMECNKRHWFIV